MAKTGKFSASDFKKLQTKLNKLPQNQIDKYLESCAKELAARLLAKVIKRTPVGDYTGTGSGKVGGTLRRGWTSQSHSDAASGSGKGTTASTYVDSLKINHFGDTFVVEIINPVEYASYVEYGHRTSDHKGWVQGRFMLTISENELRDIAPNVLEAKINKFLKGVV